MTYTTTTHWTELPIAATDRKRRVYGFTATGAGEFPLDMLRYDRCFPGSNEAVSNMEPDNRAHRSVKLLSYNEPTPARWKSFGWTISATPAY